MNKQSVWSNQFSEHFQWSQADPSSQGFCLGLYILTHPDYPPKPCGHLRRKNRILSKDKCMLFPLPHLRTWVLLLQWPYFWALSDVEFYTFDFECRNLTLRKDTFIYQCYNGYLRLTCQTNILRVAQVIQAASQAFSAILADAWGWSALGPLGSMSSRLFTENPTLMPSKLVKLSRPHTTWAPQNVVFWKWNGTPYREI